MNEAEQCHIMQKIGEGLYSLSVSSCHDSVSLYGGWAFGTQMFNLIYQRKQMGCSYRWPLPCADVGRAIC